MERAAQGRVSRSPLAADGRIYFLNTQGLTTVVAASPRFSRLAENQLDDETFASPIVSDGHIYIRGRSAVLPGQVARRGDCFTFFARRGQEKNTDAFAAGTCDVLGHATGAAAQSRDKPANWQDVQREANASWRTFTASTIRAILLC